MLLAILSLSESYVLKIIISMIINIAVAFDKEYLPPFHALLASIFENNKQDTVAVHAIATGINDFDKEEINQFAKNNNSTVKFYTIEKSFVDKLFIHKDSHFKSLAIFYRLFFPLLVEESLKNLVYLDVDTIVIKSLRGLASTDTGSYPVGAVTDAWPYDHSYLNIYDEEGYFNSGVLLINVQNWRNQRVTERALEFIHENPEKCVAMPDQDALNGVLVNNWKKLSNSYNFQFNYIPNPISKAAIPALLSDKVIIHFTTGNKPWLMECANRLKFLYHFYLERSPYATKGKYTNHIENKAQLVRILKLKLNNFYTDNELLSKGWRRIKTLLK